MTETKKRIVVIGGGPTSALLQLALAQAQLPATVLTLKPEGEGLSGPARDLAALTAMVAPKDNAKASYGPLPSAHQHTQQVKVQERQQRGKKLAQRVRNGFIIAGR